MGIKVSVFDILSYLLPGLVYCLALVLVGDFFVEDKLILMILSLSGYSIALVTIFSYILGHAFQPLHKLNIFKFFFNNQQDMKYQDSKLLKLIEKINPELRKLIDTEKYSVRGILVRILKLHNESLANSSSRFLAVSLFLRNLSSAFLLLALLIPLTSEYLSITIMYLLTFLFIVLSVTLFYRHKRFERYAYKVVAESIIALSLKDFDFIEGKFTIK